MVMGQEERKNKAKLEKTQIQLASNSNEYETAIKCLQETTGKWNKDWKDACDVSMTHLKSFLLTNNGKKFQDLEEERLDYAKSSLWTFANIASTVCVSDDAVSSQALTLIIGEINPSFSLVKRFGSHLKIARSRKT